MVVISHLTHLSVADPGGWGGGGGSPNLPGQWHLQKIARFYKFTDFSYYSIIKKLSLKFEWGRYFCSLVAGVYFNFNSVNYHIIFSW